MKKYSLIMFVLVMFLFSFSAISAAELGINIQAQGVVKVNPDMAKIVFTIETLNMDANLSMDENKKIFENFKKELLTLGIKQEDIKTVSYNLYKDMVYEKDVQVFKGYKVVNSFEVSIYNLDQTSKVLMKSTKSGINRIYDVRFTVKNQEKYYQEALKLAVKNAKEKAQIIAKEAGLSIDKPNMIEEISSGNYEMPILYSANAKMSEDASEVSPGELEIKASVRMQFK